MDNKRKASGVNGVEPAADTPDRASKRRKLQDEFGDLALGESAASTTAYGMNILESIRATTDKSGRPVAPYFETLPSRADDPEYYKRVRLPLCLELIEDKLQSGFYPNLSTLEGDFKRLVSNAKETNIRTSEIFSDAERVRKAVSNLMVKYNPAYKSGNYQATATPLPSDPTADVESPRPAESVRPARAAQPKTPARPTTTKPTRSARSARQSEPQPEPEDESEEDAEGEADEDEEEGEGDEQEDEDPSSARRARRGPGRPPKNPIAHAKKVASRPPAGKADHHYENVPFKGLSFQQAQEKVIEEMIRKKDDSDFNYYEAFLYLPPRSLKDYYEVIAEPLSLKALQKQVRGQHGRGEATYVSDFKTWTALEDQASLLWKNAYHYNEENSDIYTLGQELEKFFAKLVKEGRENVPEPPQPKIKLKVPQNGEAAPANPKKILIHVAGKANSAANSPAPLTAQSGDGEPSRTGTPLGKHPFGHGAASLHVEKTRSQSGSVPSASPAPGSVKPEQITRPSSGFAHGATNFQQFAPPISQTPVPIPPTNGVSTPAASSTPPPPAPPKQSPAEILEAQKYRPRPIEESEALMPKLQITSHPALNLENRLCITVPASPTESQQELVFNVPSSHFRLQLRPFVAQFLEAQQREWKLNVQHDTSRLYPVTGPFDKRGEPIFETQLRFGMNRLEVSLVAALPKGQKAAHGLNMELEKYVVHFNLLRHS